MKGLRYGFKFFYKNLYSNIFMALEIALLLIAANALMGFYNNIAFLYTPFEDILTSDGVLFLPFSEAEDTDLDAIAAKLKGGGGVYASYSGGLPETTTMVHFVDDSIYDKFALPLSSGRFEKGCAVASYDSGYKVGDTVKTLLGEVRVSGVLTENTYYPQIVYFEDADGLYQPHRSGVDDEKFFIMGMSAACRLYGDMSLSCCDDAVMISYKGCSESEKAQNTAMLKNYGEVRELSVINARSEQKLSEQYDKFIPFIYMISIAVMIGIVSLSIITSLECRFDLTILRRCGAGKSDAFFVSLGKNICIIILSLIIASAALIIFKATGLMSRSGITIKQNILPLTLKIIALCTLMCQLVCVVTNARQRLK